MLWTYLVMLGWATLSWCKQVQNITNGHPHITHNIDEHYNLTMLTKSGTADLYTADDLAHASDKIIFTANSSYQNATEVSWTDGQINVQILAYPNMSISELKLSKWLSKGLQFVATKEAPQFFSFQIVDEAKPAAHRNRSIVMFEYMPNNNNVSKARVKRDIISNGAFVGYGNNNYTQNIVTQSEDRGNYTAAELESLYAKLNSTLYLPDGRLSPEAFSNTSQTVTLEGKLAHLLLQVTPAKGIPLAAVVIPNIFNNGSALTQTISGQEYPAQYQSQVWRTVSRADPYPYELLGEFEFVSSPRLPLIKRKVGDSAVIIGPIPQPPPQEYNVTLLTESGALGKYSALDQANLYQNFTHNVERIFPKPHAHPDPDATAPIHLHDITVTQLTTDGHLLTLVAQTYPNITFVSHLGFLWSDFSQHVQAFINDQGRPEYYTFRFFDAVSGAGRAIFYFSYTA